MSNAKRQISSPRQISATICVLALLSAAIAAAEKGPDERLPNLIVLMADDLGAHELGCYGHPKHRTPNLDELARRGVQFATCYSTPICHPTRFEIMTGQYGHHNKVYQFPGRAGGPKAGSPEDDIAKHLTFAQVLKPRGYATAHAGKWQLTGAVPTLVHECGFDEYCMWAYKHNLPPGVEHTGGWEGAKGGKTSRYWHPSIVKNAEYLSTDPDDYGPDIFTDFVIDFIRRHRDEPFFVYYPMALTHGPFYVTPDSIRAGDDKFKNSKEWNWQANVEYTDKLVGRIVDALKELDLWDNTMLMFTGDNGTGGNGKGQVTELGARVPGIVAGPGVVKQIGLSDELVDLSDVLPTLADLAGAELPAGHPIDGHSFAPLLRGEEFQGREWIYAYLGNGRVVRTKRWLLEKNTPKQDGRLLDCGDCRDGSRYRDVTDSQDAEVLAAWALMRKILADKPVPDVSNDSRPTRVIKKKSGKGGRQKSGKAKRPLSPR
jgi:arylsulfatase A-like enzyme